MASNQTNSIPKIIDDLGSNNGDNTPYYLLKAEKVIASEASIKLYEPMAARFRSQVSHNRLIIENCKITENQDGEINLYIHNQHHRISSLFTPSIGEENTSPQPRSVPLV